MEEELMMEAWHLLKEEESGPLPILTFPLIIKPQPTKFQGHGSLSPACL